MPLDLSNLASAGANAPDAAAAPPATPAAPDTTVAPAAAAPSQAAPPANDVQAQMAGPLAAEKAAYQKAADLANTSTAPPPPGPHARLLAMVQGLALGADSFGKAIATHGREGGYEEVQQVEQAKQSQQIQAQQARDAAKNAQISQQLMVADTNNKLAHSIMFMHSIPNELAKSDLEVSGEQQKQDIAGAEAAQRFGMAPKAYLAALSDPTPVNTGSGAAASPFVTKARQQLQASTGVLGADDPYVKQLQTVLANPQATAKDLAQATNTVANQRGMQADAQKQIAEQETAATNAPFGAKADPLNAAMLSRYQVLNPSAKALPPGLAMSANSTPKDFERADKILQQTENAQATKANRDIVNGMRQQTIALSGQGAPQGNTKLGGDAYIASLPAPEQALVKEIGSGRAAPTRIDMILSRNPRLMAEVALAFPDVDTSKLSQYPTTYKDFTSGKTSIALNAGGTALGHLKELQDLNTKASHIPHTPAWTAYQNKVDTVSSELAKFYGDASIPAIASIKETLASTLPGNREAAIHTQATSMGDKLDSFEQTWKNAAPSKSYEAPMPGISDKAKAARAALDPNYAANQQSSAPAQPNSAQQTSVATPSAVPGLVIH